MRRVGSRIEAHGNGLRWLEWSVSAEVEPTPEAGKAASPAPWITLDMLREQRHRVTNVERLQFHANRSHVSAARWLPEGAWQACAASYEVDPDEPLTLGIDVGGPSRRSCSTRCALRARRCAWLIIGGRLRHFAHPTLDAHVANAAAKPTPRGWRLVKSGENAHVDALVALAMAAERAEKRPDPVRVIGWL